MSLAWFPQIMEFFTPALQTRVAYWHAGSGTDSNSDAVCWFSPHNNSKAECVPVKAVGKRKPKHNPQYAEDPNRPRTSSL